MPMKRYYFKTLRARLAVLLVLPVIVMLMTAGLGGFFFARDRMIKQWRISVRLQLERAAHEIETRLSKPVALMALFSDSGTGKANVGLPDAIVQRLETLPGVVRVDVTWYAGAADDHHHGERSGAMDAIHAGRFKQGTIVRMSLPTVDKISNQKTVSMTMILLDGADTAVGHLEIVLQFDVLVSGITTSAWWHSAMACIVDRDTGRIVLASGQMRGRSLLGETGSPLEQSVKTKIFQETVGTLWAPGHPPDRVAGFHSLRTFPWTLVVFADGKTILAPIIDFRNGFMIGALLLIVFVLTIIHLTIGRMSTTIRHLAWRAILVAGGDYGEKIRVSSRDEIGRLAESFNIMIEGLREKETIRRKFGHYVDPDFARVLLKKPEAGRLGGRRQDVVVLMTDIRGFTPMTKNLSPEDTIEVLNGYFSAMIPLLQRHHGIIVDFVGDGILAFFEPADESLARATERCLQCAFEMHTAVGGLNRKMSMRNLPALQMGIGINCGPVVVGNIGSQTRKKYGIVGAVVNITQRIQAEAGAGEVVVSRSVYEMVENRVRVIRRIVTPLKGIASRVRLYAIVPSPTQPQP